MHPVLMLCPNGLELTARAVESVLNQDIEIDLHVVDQGTTDGTEQFLKGLVATVKSWRFVPQLGVSAGWNFGLVGVFRNYDYCLVVNNDVELLPKNYRVLLEDGGPFVTGVSVASKDQLIDEPFIPTRRPHPDFSNFLIRKSCWESVGPFDETMKLYASDGDYHLRMHNIGIEAYTIGVPFYHVASGTLKSASPLERTLIEWQADRDRDTFAAKWGCQIGSPQYYRLFSGHETPSS